MAEYKNNDGLVWRYGTDEAKDSNIGAYSYDGDLHYVEIMVKASETPAVADNSVLLDSVFALPKGAVLERVEKTSPTTTFVGTGATLNIGLVDQSDGTSNADADAVVTEITLTELNAVGSANEAGWLGAAVNATPAVGLANAKLITWEVNTAALTAGECVFRIFWRIPKVDEDTLVWDKSA